jgi:aminoglycoside N3'-acetyltransferase
MSIKNFKKIYKKFLFQNLKKIKLMRGDNIYVSVNTGEACKPFFKHMHKKKITSEKFSLILIELLEEYVGKNGGIIVPAFSFQYIKDRFFDKKKTKTILGPFSQCFLNKNFKNRTSHPTHSICCYGKINKKITKYDNKFSFGENSPYSQFVNLKVKFLNIGVNLKNSITYIHHIEHLNGCAHRYYKNIYGQIKVNNKIIKKNYYCFVKFLFKDFETNAGPVVKTIKAKNILHETKCLKTYFSLVKAEDVYNQSLALLDKNPQIFMNKKLNIRIIGKLK